MILPFLESCKYGVFKVQNQNYAQYYVMHNNGMPFDVYRV